MRVFMGVLLCVFSITLEANQLLQEVFQDFKPEAQEVKAGAVTVKSVQEINVNSSNQVESQEYFLIAILDQDAARDYSVIQSRFNSYFEKIELNFARIIDEDGTVHDVSPDAVQVKTKSSDVAFDDIRSLNFSLPSVQAGSFIEYKVTRKTIRSVIENHWYDAFYFTKAQSQGNNVRLDPVRESVVVLNVAADALLNIMDKSDGAIKYEVVTDKVKSISWRLKNIPAYAVENNIQSLDFLRRVYVSSVPDWEFLDQWAANVYLKASIPGPEIKDLVDQLLPVGISRSEKVKKIYYWVQKNVRYIQSDMRRGGIVPHSANQVLDHRYGDCKDQAMLLVSMFKAAGIEAYPSLIGTYPSNKLETSIPSLMFSHMIVYLPDRGDGQESWIDTSTEAGSFPGIDWVLQERMTFVIDGRGGQLKKMPSLSSANLHQILIDQNLSLDEDVLNLSMEITLNGKYDNLFKSVSLHGKNYEELLQKVALTLHPELDLKSVLPVASNSIEAPTKLIAQYDKKSVWNSEEKIILSDTLVRAISLFTELLPLPKKERSHDYYLGTGFTIAMTSSIEMLSNEFSGEWMNGPSQVSNQWFEYNSSTDKSEDKYTVKSVIKVKKNLISLEDFPKFVDSFENTIDHSKWQMLVEKDPLKKRIKEINKKYSKNQSNIERDLSMIKLYIDDAEFDKAFDLAEKIVESAPDNAEAHYYFGITLGFVDQFERSEKELNLARELGYRE